MQNILGVVCIVKNEEEKIRQTLSPFVDFGIKNIFVNDTGSEDETILKVNELSSDIIVGNILFENFSQARNLTLEMAKNIFPSEVKFLLMLDCEWYAENITDLIKFCIKHESDDKDFYFINLYCENNILNRLGCLFKRDGNGVYVNELHERATGKHGCLVPKFLFKVLQSNYGINKTKKRNLEFDIPYYLSKDELITNEQIFYLAQAYHNIQDYDNAIKYYAILSEEKEDYQYICSYRIAEIYFLTKNHQMAFLYYIKAIAFNSDRCEPYLKISQLLDGISKYNWAKKACEIKMPESVKETFLETECYNIYRYLELARGCLNVKKYKEGTVAINKVLEKIDFRSSLYEEVIFLERLLKRRVVILILTSPNYHEYNEIMERYLNNFEFDFYFYEYSNEYSELTIRDHHIYLPGEESYLPGILSKTIEVFKIFSMYDYIIRLNSTTFINLNEVKLGCENFTSFKFSHLNEQDSTKRKNFNYFGYFNSTNLVLNVDYGVTQEFLNEIGGNLEFVSGKCIILSNSAIRIFLNSKFSKYNIMDDIAIAASMKGYYKIDHINSFNNDLYISSEKNILTFCSSPEIMDILINENSDFFIPH